MIRPAMAAVQYGMSRRTIARRVRDDPDFPQPIRVSKRLLLFRCSDLEAYFSSKQAQRATTPKEEITNA